MISSEPIMSSTAGEHPPAIMARTRLIFDYGDCQPTTQQTKKTVETRH